MRRYRFWFRDGSTCSYELNITLAAALVRVCSLQKQIMDDIMKVEQVYPL